jgi:predicted enzyme related to lactoylglutathione lyase
MSFDAACPVVINARYYQSMLKDAPIVPYIPAKDVARARAFYEEKVGLVPREEVAGGVVYECGKGSWIFLYPTGAAGTSKASQAFWQVDDIEAEVAQLKKRGVVFEEYNLPGLKTVSGIMTSGNNKAAWFKDTEGNIMAIIQG